jgi:hypothetical protein
MAPIGNPLASGLAIVTMSGLGLSQQDIVTVRRVGLRHTEQPLGNLNEPTFFLYGIDHTVGLAHALATALG